MNIIAACCRNRGIGLKGVLPWKFKKDLQYFKEITIGDGNNAVIVGNNTYRKLPVLPKRHTLVLTNNTSSKINTENTFFFNNVSTLKDFCKEKKYTDVWVAGGENVYNQFLLDPIVKALYLTTIDIDLPCDTFFPELPLRYVMTSKHATSERGVNLSFEVYRNKTGGQYHKYKGTLLSSSMPDTFMPTGLNI